MSNEVTTNAPALPAFLQAHVTANAGRPTADIASLTTSQNSTPRLSLRGKVFRFMEGQDEVHKSKDGISVFILGVEPGAGLFTKTFYSKPYGGADSSGEPPDCSSADGVRPDPWVQQPQHHECKSCPKNLFGSATSRKGRASKACHDSKRLMIVRADVDEPIAERTMYLSQIPVSSLKPLAAYGGRLSDMGVEAWMVQTKLTMDEDSEFPELRFDIGGFVAEDQMADMKARSEKREWTASRNLMLAAQPARPQLPAHLASQLGAAAPVAQPVAVAAAPAEPAAPAVAGGPAPSNEEVLKKW